MAHRTACLLLFSSLLDAPQAARPSFHVHEQVVAKDREDPARLRVAVIGGGIAGSATALELLRFDHVDVTLFEQAEQIGHPQSASGIIAALTIFNSKEQYWKGMDSPDEIYDFVQSQLSVYKFRSTSWGHWYRNAQFAQRMWLNSRSADVRSTKDFQKKFVHASRLRLEEQLDRFPEMCAAVKGPYCCREGSKAREWMDRMEGDGANVSCAVKAGVLHTWLEESSWSKANKLGQASAGGWELATPESDPSGHLSNAESFLRQDDVKGVLWNSVDEGFVQVESLYPILTDVFQGSGQVTLALRCLVSSLEQPSGSGGIKIVAPGCAQAGVYDRVIVAGGANSVNILEGQDKLLFSDIMPIKGMAVVTQEPVVENAQLGVGMQVEDYSHYVRPTVTGGIAYGFGKEIGEWDDLLAPKYHEWPVMGPEATELGRTVLNQTDVVRLAGIRPLSAWGASFPLLKRYDGRWAGLVLNTGYGFYGYTLSWKSAQLAAEVAVLGEVSDPEFAASVGLYTGCGAMPCAMWHMYLFLGAFAQLLVLLLLLACCACGFTTYCYCGGARGTCEEQPGTCEEKEGSM